MTHKPYQIVYGDIRRVDPGVKAHADGRYVVVSMPDGTRVVREVKEAKP